MDAIARVLQTSRTTTVAGLTDEEAESAARSIVARCAGGYASSFWAGEAHKWATEALRRMEAGACFHSCARAAASSYQEHRISQGLPK